MGTNRRINMLQNNEIIRPGSSHDININLTQSLNNFLFNIKQNIQQNNDNNNLENAYKSPALVFFDKSQTESLMRDANYLSKTNKSVLKETSINDVYLYTLRKMNKEYYETFSMNRLFPSNCDNIKEVIEARISVMFRLSKVCEDLNFKRETYHNTCVLFDKYLNIKNYLDEKKILLFGVTCLY